MECSGKLVFEEILSFMRKLDVLSAEETETMKKILQDSLTQSPPDKLVDGLRELSSALQKILEREKNNTDGSPYSRESTEKRPVRRCLLQTTNSALLSTGPKEDRRPTIDPSLVQIHADKSEIERRIHAFIERKQEEVDGINRREFCSITEDSVVESCARTEAVFIPRLDGKSHVKVTRVVNRFGPQTRPGPNITPKTNIPQATILPSCDIKKEPGTSQISNAGLSSSSSVLFGVEERLRNMESHLKIGPSSVSQANVYSRLKNLEERILHLESLSPEYFDYLPPGVKRRKLNKEPERSTWAINKSEDQSINDIDLCIRQLKQSLLSRQKRGINSGRTSEDYTPAMTTIKQEKL